VIAYAAKHGACTVNKGFDSGALIKRITCGARGEATAAAAKAAGLHGAELRASYDGCSAAGTAAVAVIVRRGLAALKFIDLSGDLVDLILQIRNLVIDLGLLLSQVVNLLLKFGGDFFERVYLSLKLFFIRAKLLALCTELLKLRLQLGAFLIQHYGSEGHDKISFSVFLFESLFSPDECPLHSGRGR
jgi:hypothetical protein